MTPRRTYVIRNKQEEPCERTGPCVRAEQCHTNPVPVESFLSHVFLRYRAVSILLHSMQRYNAFLIAQKLGLSRRMCHEEYGTYSEIHGDHILHEEDPRPAYEASQSRYQENVRWTCGYSP